MREFGSTMELLTKVVDMCVRKDIFKGIAKVWYYVMSTRYEW